MPNVHARREMLALCLLSRSWAEILMFTGSFSSVGIEEGSGEFSMLTSYCEFSDSMSGFSILLFI